MMLIFIYDIWVLMLYLVINGYDISIIIKIENLDKSNLFNILLG